MSEAKRDGLLTTYGVLFSILAVSNFLKPWQLGGEQTGFVLLGHRLTGTPNAIIGPLFGVYLAVYALGIFGKKRYALPMGQAYPAYVILNLVAFIVWGPKPPGSGIGHALFGIVYASVAIGVSLSCAMRLKQRRSELS